MRPCVHIHPSMVVDRGQMIVLVADKRSPQAFKAVMILAQFSRSSVGVFPPQYKSSASFETNPACSWFPKTLHISSSRDVSDPGIPMAHLV